MRAPLIITLVFEVMSLYREIGINVFVMASRLAAASFFARHDYARIVPSMARMDIVGFDGNK